MSPRSNYDDAAYPHGDWHAAEEPRLLQQGVWGFFACDRWHLLSRLRDGVLLTSICFTRGA